MYTVSMKRYLILNFKTYPEASGKQAVELARIVDQTDNLPDVEVIICPQAADIYRVREHFPYMPIWAQHTDAIEPGKHTGWTSPENIKMAGANGTILNHSEHQIEIANIERHIQTANQFGLTVGCAVADLEMAQTIIPSNPDMIMFEPPSLVSSGTSLIDVDHATALNFHDELRGSFTNPILIGAGISDENDVRGALQIGYDGVMLASGFATAADPGEFLRKILSAFA